MAESGVRQEVADFLSSRGIGYRSYCHRPIFTVEDGREVAEAIGVDPCKTLLLADRRRRYYMLMATGGSRVSLPELAQQIGSPRLSLAKGEALEGILRASAGAVSPLGLIFDRERLVNLCIDRELLDREYVVAHPCVNTESYVFKTSDFLDRFLPSVGCGDPAVVTL